MAIDIESNQTETADIGQKADEQGVLTPITPSGAAAVGATPKQADMGGTKVQKKEALTPKKTLSEDIRLAGYNQRAATGAEQSALTRADRIKQFGALSSRIDDLLQQRFSQEQPSVAEGAQETPTTAATTLSINQEALALTSDPESFKLALDDYLCMVVEKDQAGEHEDLIKTKELICGQI